MANSTLSKVELQNLRAWLKGHAFKVINLHRDCADAVQVATLINGFWPKLVDLYNYSYQCSFDAKFSNWQFLNKKVLSQMGIEQRHVTLEKLAKGTPGVVDELLYAIMLLKEKENALSREEFATDEEKVWAEKGELVIFDVTRRVGDAVVQVPKKVILCSIYEEKCIEEYVKGALVTLAGRKVAELKDKIKRKNVQTEALSGHLTKCYEPGFNKRRKRIEKPKTCPRAPRKK